MTAEELAPRSLSTGFEHMMDTMGRTATPDLSDSLIALDTNVLLEFYRQHSASSEKILDDMDRLRSQLFMPAQVQREFWLRRDDVLRGIWQGGQSKELAAAERAVKAVVDAAVRRDISREEHASLKKLVDDSFTTIREATRGKVAADRAKAAMREPHQDVVLGRLSRLFDGRVGSPYGADVMASVRDEGQARFAARRPPGYQDAAKVDGGYGDFVLWRQLVDAAREASRPVILVTNDVKEDWWRHHENGVVINARAELVEEMRDEAGVAFALMTFDGFVNALAAEPESVLSESDVDADDDEVSAEIVDLPASMHWTLPEFEAVLLHLAESGNDRQAKVLQAAAESLGGVVGRAEVLALLQMPSDAKLTGFTKVIRTAQAQLVETGIVRDGLPRPLRAGYDGPGKAQRFAVPEEVAESFGLYYDSKRPMDN